MVDDDGRRTHHAADQPQFPNPTPWSIRSKREIRYETCNDQTFDGQIGYIDTRRLALALSTFRTMATRHEYAYDKNGNPFMGGHSATYDPALRNLGKDAAIRATQRVLRSEIYEPTGDDAFDLRAQAFRNALLNGQKEAFQESHEAFKSVGL